MTPDIQFRSVNSPPDDYSQPTYWSDLEQARRQRDWKRVTIMLLKGFVALFVRRSIRAMIFPEYFAPDLGNGGIQTLLGDDDGKARK